MAWTISSGSRAPDCTKSPTLRSSLLVSLASRSRAFRRRSMSMSRSLPDQSRGGGGADDLPRGRRRRGAAVPRMLDDDREGDPLLGRAVGREADEPAVRRTAGDFGGAGLADN